MIHIGIVEDRISDPLKLGRCKVRIFGLHTHDKTVLPTSDLPWAIMLQSTDSAANSGIGKSPTGVVEGSTVAVIFSDIHKQQPIIIGTLGGIPPELIDQPVPKVTTVEQEVLKSGNGSTVTDGFGQPILSGGQKEVPIIKNPKILSASPACYALIYEEEKLSSLKPGRNSFVSKSKADTLPANTPIYSYQDTRGIWTIGWGNTYLKDGSAVNEFTTLTKAEADELFKYKIETEFVPSIRRNCQAPVTQSMFDAMVSLAYNAGTGAFARSNVLSAINTTEYGTAANLILDFRTGNNSGLKNRRVNEKTLFCKDGFPAKDMAFVNETPESKKKEPNDATQNPVVKVKPPVKESNANARYNNGFRDPNGVYPRIVEEPDTHRLARHEKIDQTIVYSKERARVTNIVSGSTTWSQPQIPYNSLYPYNKTHVTESGHVVEYDDTPDSERIHTYHRSGTYTEIDRNGTQVNRIVGDSFEIMERNGHLLVKGSMAITIVGNANVTIQNDANIDVYGNTNMTTGGNMNIGAQGDINIAAGGNFNVDATKVYLNSDKATNTKSKGTAQGVPEFSTLTFAPRHQELTAQYETPEEGDSTNYVNDLISAGIIEESPEPVKVEEAKPITKTPEKISTDCSLLPADGVVDYNYKLSPNVTVGDIDKSRILHTGNFAVNATKAEILCNMKLLAVNCIEPIKSLYPSFTITSGLRNYVPKGGSLTSDHLWGCAIDIVINGFDREAHYKAVQEIVKVLPTWSQVLLEYSGPKTVWIHVSFNSKRGFKQDQFTFNNHKLHSRTFTLLT